MVPRPQTDPPGLRVREEEHQGRPRQVQGQHQGDVGQGLRGGYLQPRPRERAGGGDQTAGGPAGAGRAPADRGADPEEEGCGGAQAGGAAPPAERAAHRGARRRPHGRAGGGLRAEVVPGAGAEVRPRLGLRAVRVPPASQGRCLRGPEARSQEMGFRGQRAGRAGDDRGDTRPRRQRRDADVAQEEAGQVPGAPLRRQGGRHAGHPRALARPSPLHGGHLGSRRRRPLWGWPGVRAQAWRPPGLRA
mmetsp:Transcript_53937/g.167166  ORF Transcript_53937/g.167166 Transcript_53937/m.167166 type:complete len:247 (+) Transcript_53937:937-1677(+)